MSFEEVIKSDFEIRNLKIYFRNSSFAGYELQKFGWLEPIEYRVKGCVYDTGYCVKQDTYGDWYLIKDNPYTGPVMRLYHIGGENWNSYY